MGQLTDALLANWLSATRDEGEEFAFRVSQKPKPPLPETNNAPVVSFGLIHLQKMTATYQAH